MIKRMLGAVVKKSAQMYPIVAVVGPRQSGKTTLVKSVFDGYTYLNLEELDTRRFAQEDPRGFLKTYPSRVILDEVQRVPELLSYVQAHTDEQQRAGQYILTGSQHFGLMESVSQSLAGRIALHTLLPLSLKEQRGQDVGQTVYTGGFPRIYDAHIPPRQWYGDYVQTYLDRDLRTLIHVGDLATFEKFVRLCAGRTGQIVNLTSLATDTGISHNTAKTWLSLLQISFIIFLLEPYYKNFNKRLVKAPKMYFTDTGLACWLLGIESAKQVIVHPFFGALFETLVIDEYFKHEFNRGRKPSAYFWRDKTGREVDLIVERGGTLLPVEIKAGATVNEDFFSNLRYFARLSGKEKGAVVYGGEKQQIRRGMTVYPWTQCYAVAS